MKFVKYINHRSLARLNKHPNRTGFWDFFFVYYEWWCSVTTVTENSGGWWAGSYPDIQLWPKHRQTCSCNSITLYNVGAGGFFNCKNGNELFSWVHCNTHSQLLLMWVGWSHNCQLSSCSLMGAAQWHLWPVRVRITTVHCPKLMTDFIKKKKKEMGQLNVSSTGQASFVTKCPKHFLGLNCVPVYRDKHKGAAMGNMRFFQLHNSVELGRKTVRL